MVLCIVISSKQKPYLALGLMVAIVTGCAQQPAPKSPAPIVDSSSTVELPPDDSEHSSQYWLQQAARESVSRQPALLLKAASAALKEADPTLTLSITRELAVQPEPWLQGQLPALELQAWLQLEQYQTALSIVEQTNLGQLDEDARIAFSLAAARLFKQLNQPGKAAFWLLQWDELTALQQHSGDEWQRLWRLLSQLDPVQLNQLRVDAGPRTLAWLQLTRSVQQQLEQSGDLTRTLHQWQRNYAYMPDVSELPTAIGQLTELVPYQPKRIAVLLPIHGQLRQHAQSIQNGILAAASNQPELELFFLDSMQGTELLSQELQALNIDFVIGPLQRSQVDSIQQDANWLWPTLFLNQSSQQQSLNDEHYFFSLSLEDEGSQLAEFFQRRNFNRPVVIYAQNPGSERLARHFSRQWQQYGHSSPELYSFQSRDELEPVIARLLDLEQSRQRVRQISQLIPGTVESEPHSRLDIDAIYLIADPTQTRLIKPFLDVSVSPTAPSLPIYASSRSHSIQADRSDHRDLAGLTLTDMPWMLSDQQSQALRAEFDQLFPEQDENLQRLFAMGYDALLLIPQLQQQRAFPALRYRGLTGTLGLTETQTIRRELNWARYSQRELQLIQEP
ncbi:penicillin-binding protein activator [Alkalimonas sp. NCh-2]|uniref:penicillin-binding protein activator n=1 Tax=Alkalimonas sp. NCh-2 TaxID=3144846 RepID=UPI0031F5FE5B